MIWKHRDEVDMAQALEIAGTLGKPLHYAQLLLGRGFKSRTEIRSFVTPELKNLPLPETMPNMNKAVDAFVRARERGDTVAVAGDFDADGLTATAVLVRILGSLGYKVITRIPNRFSDGYGLSPRVVKSLKSRGAGLLVTVDCGVSDVEAVEAANSIGLPVVVTDHHNIPPELPPAEAIVNPHLGGGWERSPMAGVGVAFMLAWAVQRALKFKGICPTMHPPLVENLALVALGTIADLAPLTGVNRTLVRHGLRFLSKTSWPSLSALVSSSRVDDPAAISVRDVGFGLAPKLNAAGRLGSADPVLELLVTENPLRARELAEYLDSVNRDRSNGQRNLQEKVFARLEAEGGGDGRTVVLAGEHWPKGLLGLVASRVAEQARKPTMLISIDGELATGSGRSAAGFDLYTALTHARDHCISMGGHSEAAGLRLRPENIPAFRVAFEEGASLQPEPPEEDELEVDLECALDDLVPLRGSFSDLEPFGQAHPAPVAVVRNVEVKDAGPSRNNGDRNATFHVTDGLQIYTIPAFDMSPRLPEVTKFMDLALVYTGSHWGVRDPGWKLLDFKRPGESRCPWGEGRDVTIELTSARGDGRIGSASYRAAKPGQNVEGSTDRTRPDGREGGGA